MNGYAHGADVVLVVDQGTTNTKALLVRSDGSVAGRASRPVAVSHPRPGWVEQDAAELWLATVAAARAVLEEHGEARVVGVALSTQRESAVAWSASTGRPLGPVLGWQDARTAARCTAWAAEAGEYVVRTTGLHVDAMYSAPKMRWLVDQAIAEGAPADDILLGTVDSWLLANLTGAHRTEAGNASRTLLLDLHGLDWDDRLAELFGIPQTALPQVVPSDGEFGRCRTDSGLPGGVPVVAVLADSHAALLAQGCRDAHQAKVTYGTGTSVMTPYAGFREGIPDGLVTTLAWWTADGPTYALEGNILASGAALDAMARWLGVGGGAGLSDLAAEAEGSGGVVFVPALAGLGAPHWDREATGLLLGLTGGTSRSQIARSALEGVAHQVVDVAEAVERASGSELSVLCADGGATSSALLMQIQADLADRPVRVTDVAEASALGAGLLAWRRLGAAPDAAPAGTAARVFEPSLAAGRRGDQRARWRQAVARSRGHALSATTTSTAVQLEET